GPGEKNSIGCDDQRSHRLGVYCRPDGSESRSAIGTLPHTARGCSNVDCVCGYWIERDVHDSTADIGWADKSPTRASEWSIRLLGLLRQRSSLSAGSFQRSNWNSTVSYALSNKPIFRWSLFLCAAGIGYARLLIWFASFLIRANGSW